MSALNAAPAHDRRPLVTIAIPTFNRASLLKRCIESVLLQTYDNFEILISDNASPDHTQDVIRSFDDPRLRAIRQPTNIGLLPNWNACLAHARGDYIVLVCDDDRIAPWLLERCVGMLNDHPHVPIVIALSNLHRHSAGAGHTYPARTSHSMQTGIHEGTDILLAYLRGEISFLVTCAMVMRTDVLRKAGGFPLDFPHAADVAAWAPLLLRGRAGFVNEACATFHEHGDSETSRLGLEKLLSDGWKVERLLLRLSDEHITDPARRHSLQTHIRLGFARRGLMALSYCRQNGDSLYRILRYTWRSRRALGIARTKDIARFAAVVLCPRLVVDWLRRLRRITLGQWSLPHERVAPDHR